MESNKIDRMRLRSSKIRIWPYSGFLVENALKCEQKKNGNPVWDEMREVGRAVKGEINRWRITRKMNQNNGRKTQQKIA